MPMLVATKAPEAETPRPPSWLPKVIVFRHESGAVTTMECLLYGTLAVHPTLEGMRRKAVTITHRPSRLAVAFVDTVEQAQTWTKWLWERCGKTWLDETVDKSALPADVVRWCEENQK